MVLQLQFWRGIRLETLILRLAFLLLVTSYQANANGAPSGSEYLREAADLYHSQSYFMAARYSFAALETDPSLKADAYAWITLGLVHAGLPHAASYFFIRTLQTEKKSAIHSVLSQTQALLMTVGADILRKYLIRYTTYDDYDLQNRSAYLYALSKDALLSGDTSRAIDYLNGIDSRNPIFPFALQLKGTALAILGRDREAIESFEECSQTAGRIVRDDQKNPIRLRHRKLEADDLTARCIAGKARTLYEKDEFFEADRTYDSIPKKSLIWTDILFEQGWNSFARQEYNRSLGKLVSYKSPALSFVFNPEIDVLRAQSFLALCLYSDANEVVNEFNSKYNSPGIEIKRFMENNRNSLPEFYELGKNVLHTSVYTRNSMYRVVNRFIRGAYFQSLVEDELEVNKERETIDRFDRDGSIGRSRNPKGFSGFLVQVLNWRMKSIQLFGGAFVKNSLLDYHTSLIEDFEKMAFIKLEMLKRAKDVLIHKENSTRIASGDRNRGNVQPSRRDDQYQWSFNGEFWNDELGDYVFGLKSECKS